MSNMIHLGEASPYVTRGKELIAAAITEKGVVTPATASFPVMAENIRSIVTGLKCYLIITTVSGNGSSVTAIQGSTTLTGTVSNEQCILEVPSKGDWEVTVTSPTYGISHTKTINVGDGYDTFIMFPQWVLDLKSAAVGSTATVDGYEWLVVHKTSTTTTLGLRYWYTDTVFNSVNNNNIYKDSTIANLAATFESNTLSALTKTFLNNVTVPHERTPYESYDVTAKVFIPSKAQFEGGFSYYATQNNRIFRDSSGTAKYTWTSSAGRSSYTLHVSTDGSLGDAWAHNTFGFRPHIEVNIDF